MKFECPQRADKQARTHTLTTHSTTKSFENPEGAISKSAKEKRMIILLRVNLGAFCDYSYLFGAAWYSQRQNERKYRSLLGYENTCRPQIIPRRLSPQHSFIGSISTSLTLLLHNHFSFTCSLPPSHLLSRWVVWGKKEHLPLVIGQLLVWCLCGSLLELVLPPTFTENSGQIPVSWKSELWCVSLVNTAAARPKDGGLSGLSVHWSICPTLWSRSRFFNKFLASFPWHLPWMFMVSRGWYQILLVTPKWEFIMNV